MNYSWLLENTVIKKSMLNELTENKIIDEVNKAILKNKNNIKEIPKIAFTFWEGKEFSYLHLLTIQSFAFYNPDFKIIIYSTKNNSEINSIWNTTEHKTPIVNNLSDINILKSIKNVEFIEVDLDYYFPNVSITSCVHKSDIIRIIKLKEHGGVWIDFDILFYRKIPDNLLKLRINDIGIFTYHGFVAIGFIFSHKNNPILDYILMLIAIFMKDTKLGYQSLGTKIWSRLPHIPQFKSYINFLSNDICYSYLWNNLAGLFKNTIDITTDSTIGIHWYNGADIAKEYINNADFSNINPDKSIMDKYVYNVINDLKTV
jgi:hypothetical protein